MFFSIAAVAIGGALGSLLRWVLGVQMNGLVPNLPFGTLIANLSAAYIIGVSIALFQRFTDVPFEWRLFVITGILGGLSTFSTFSAEVTAHLQAGRTIWALGEIAANLFGSLTLTVLGISTIGVLMR